ncbi:MAG TPA: enoyl-CoA hydratase [Candidatus Fraserbacteria bacterium]|nr:enoyl-CoA hydratase [Candidatus Fraserbacteria bacterium]
MNSIQVEGKDAVVTVTLDRPPLNVLDIAMMRELRECLGALDDAKVIVLAARGKAFCAGVDVADHTENKVETMIKEFHGLLRALWTLPQPVITSVGGAALGGGMELALSCDLIIASESAKFAQPEVKVGVFPPIAALLLPRLIGRQAALECVLRGESWSAARAQELGLVNAVVPDGQLDSTVRRWAEGLASLSVPVVQLAKKATLIGWNQEELDGRLAQIERLYLDELMGLEDAREGLNAFMEKRAPRWKDH